MLRRHLLRVSALVLAATAAPSLAQEPFLSGVYLGSQKLCDQAKSSSLKSVLDAGEYVLTAQGLKNNQEDCQFLRVDKARGSAAAWLVSTLCLSPDGNYPDLYSVSRLDDGRLSVMSVYGGEDDSADAESDGADDPADPAAKESVPQTAAPQPPANGTAGADTESDPDSGDAQVDTDDNGVEAGFYVACPGVASP